MTVDDRAVEAELERMRARLRDESSTGGTVSSASFSAGFADRVVVRLAASPVAPTLADGLALAFRRMAPLAAAAVLVLSTLNLVSSRGTDQTLAERLVGLPDATVASALSLDGAFAAWVP